jgi:multidrug efflux pump subunit AcrA (membrane-fusion protein)
MLWAAGATGVQTTPGAASDERDRVTIDQCTVTLIEQAEVPAQEAGVLKSVAMKEGRQVSEGELLAQIDDAKTQMEVKVAQAKLAVAKEKSADDINVQYATASAEVARADLLGDEEANNKHAGAVTAEAIREKKMKVVETELGIKKSKLEMRIAADEADEAQVEVEAAEEDLNRRQIRSPLNGVIVKVHRHAGEWVQPGDPVLHVIRIDHLWVEGLADATQHGPNSLQNRTAKVLIKLAGGKEMTVPGKVIFVDPRIQSGNVFLVRVEVQNIEQGGGWVLCPGLSAKMTVLLK